MKVGVDLPKSEAAKEWQIARKKNGPMVAPVVSNKQAHDTFNHRNRKVTYWFRKEYPDAMNHIMQLGK